MELSGLKREVVHTVCLISLSKWAELSGQSERLHTRCVYSACLSGRSYLAKAEGRTHVVFTPLVYVGGAIWLKQKVVHTLCLVCLSKWAELSD